MQNKIIQGIKEKVQNASYGGIVLMMILAIATGSILARTVYTVREYVKHRNVLFYEPHRNRGKSILGMWILFPEGEIKDNLYAEIVFLRSIGEGEAIYETSYLAKEEEGWNEERHSFGRADLFDYDIDGVKYFEADDTIIYMEKRGLYFGKYDNEDFLMKKLDFYTFEECEEYLSKI